MNQLVLVRNGEEWEFNSYGELSKEIWALVPKEKQNKLVSKMEKPLFETVISRVCVIFGVGIVVFIIALFISKKRENKKKQNFQNIYTGEKAKDYQTRKRVQV